MQSRRDIKAAEVLRDHGAYEWAIFLAQQAAERVLKAYLFWQGEASFVGHSIRSLTHKCTLLNPAFDAVHDAGKLDDFYNGPRFPDEFTEEVPADAVNAEDAEAAVELARQTVSLVEELLAE